jgi:hypothetical protein
MVSTKSRSSKSGSRRGPRTTSDTATARSRGGLRDPKIRERIAELDGGAVVGSPVDLRKLIVEETEKWGILTTEAEIEHWMTAPAEETLKLQRPLPDGALKIVATGAKEDPAAAMSLL